jgi:hypothetical protein
MDVVPLHKVDIKALRLTINALRRAELDFLDPHTRRVVSDSAKAYLFGVKSSPLPCVCKVLGINLSAARLLILTWKAQGRVGDPVFGYLNDPKNLMRAEHGLPLQHPNFESIYAGIDHGRQSKSGVDSQ